MQRHRVFVSEIPSLVIPMTSMDNGPQAKSKDEEDMRTRKLTLILALIIAGLAIHLSLDALSAAPRTPSASQQAADQPRAVKRAAYWMVREFQNDDGGYASFSTGANQAESTIAATLDAVLALSAAGYPAGALFPGEQGSPLGYLSDHSEAVIAFAAENGGQAGKVVMALTAAAVDPRAFAGHDFLSDLQVHYEPSGAYGVADPYKQAVAMLGVAAAGQDVPAAAVTWLEDLQAADGSWDDGFGTTRSADATAFAIMALLAAGRPAGSPSIAAAVAFLAETQLADGWEYGPGLGANPNSTALVIQALSALGEVWYEFNGDWVVNGQSPLAALLVFQSASGAFQSDFGQGPFDDFYATVQAIPAAAGRPFPLPARLEAVRAALSCLDTLQDNATGGWSPFAGSPVDAQGTSRAIQAIAALGEDPRAARWTTPGGVDAVEALEDLTPEYLGGGRGGRVGIVMQGVVAAGPPADVADFAGEDLPLLMSGYLSPTGEYDSTAFGIFAHGEAMLGLLAAEEPVAPSAVNLLFTAQSGGDWGDPDSNGIALQVLGGLSRPVRAGTLDALQASQTVGGGWGFGGDVSPNSSSEVVQGLTAVGVNPLSPDWSEVVDGRLTNAATAVMAMQGDNGCWPNPFGPGDDPHSTTDAILLLTQRPDWGFWENWLPVVD
jgi:hypothetical protein